MADNQDILSRRRPEPGGVLMICPGCHADNPEGAAHCSRCGTSLYVSGDAPTVVADLDASATAASPAARKPSVGVGLASPTPSTSSGYGTPTGQWATPFGTPHILEPGSDFGPRYRIEAVLGRGGMGTVYKVYDKDLDRIVALKLVRPDLTSDPEIMRRFKQELLLARKISHKNVLRIHDLGDVGGLKFISMAYVEGEDLHQVLQKHGRLAPDHAADIARQLCEALEAAHAEGVAHRDLKPQNILIDHDGNAYISDFGLAKSLEAGAGTMTRTGEVLGTPRYMSPEQVEGRPADHRSDLYALGLILYEMVTGDTPFTGDSTLQLMYQRTKEDPKNPKLVNPDVPNYFSRIIMRCLERDPRERYQTAREVIKDLDAPRTPLSLSSLYLSLPKRSRRRRLMVAVGILVVLLAASIPAVRNFFLRSPAEVVTHVAGIPSLEGGKYIAVLPFHVLGDQASLGYIAEGLQDALTAKLFQLKDVHIASGEAVQKADVQKPIERVARDLGANLIVDGTLQGAGGKIAIIANLRDVTSGTLLWTQEFSGVPGDLLTLEDQIYGQVVNALETKLELKTSNEELARAAAHPTENVEAYQLYLKGRGAMRGRPNEKTIEEAIGNYQEALKNDPGFALAYTGLADADLQMYRSRKDRMWIEGALAAAEQAGRLNSNLPEVHFALGSVYDATGRTTEAIGELKRALELAPKSDEAYRRLGEAYKANGQQAEAIDAFEKARQIDPYYWLNYNLLGNAYFQFGDYGKALAAFRRVTDIEPDNATGYENVGNVYLAQGRYSDCIPALEKALQLSPSYDIYSNLGTAYFFLGRYIEAVTMDEKAVEISPNQEIAVGNLADAYRWAGQKDKAIATYDRAIALAYKELQVNPRDASAMVSLALYYAKKGDSADAAEFIGRARKIAPGNVEYMYNEAVVQTLAGHTSEALKTLQGALEKGYSVEQAKTDPEMKPLASTQEFKDLVQRFGGGRH